MKTTNQDKLIKDNVHEYIYIDENYFDIIDTAIFQRLKNIKQTSYASLYPSSTHDRFTHSLGTYYLGKQVVTQLWKNIGESFKLPFDGSAKDEITFTFEMACLLHDLGHAPFSHTGENFYKVKKINASLPHYDYFKAYMEKNKLDKFCYIDGLLINELCKWYEVNGENIADNDIIKNFLNDYCGVLKEDSAKPHEKMSALIALQEIKEQIISLAAKICKTDGSEECGVRFNADLFVRCIIGAQYQAKPSDKLESQANSFKNAIISLLNSDIIDVDKLDYILRDSYMTGYKNTGIDIERLIKSFTIVLEDDKWCRLAYKKNALSVIENVILANDSSRRWVQNHPIILYDTYITQRCVSETFQILQAEKPTGENIFEKFFSIDALTEKGIEWNDTERIFLASDLDVITLFKKAYVISRQKGMGDAEEIFKEYFSRDARRHPLWKSEMEFRVCFNEQLMNEDEQDRMKIIRDAVVNIDLCKNKTTGISEAIINESMWNKINEGTIEFPQSGLKLVNALKVSIF
ncbi:MAG: HD domain-containing protein [Butyrivibrio sp.]|nr:HD domain-containing protein [Butyrivibrio sp.]